MPFFVFISADKFEAQPAHGERASGDIIIHNILRVLHTVRYLEIEGIAVLKADRASGNGTLHIFTLNRYLEKEEVKK